MTDTELLDMLQKGLNTRNSELGLRIQDIERQGLFAHDTIARANEIAELAARQLEVGKVQNFIWERREGGHNG